MATKLDTPGRDADRTRAAILFAAQQIFAEKGFAAATVRDITARAGVNQSLVSRYFGGKLKLFEAALDATLNTRLMTDLPKMEFGKRIVASFADEDGRVSPLPMLFRAAADDEARAIAQRLLRERVFEPLQQWIGGADASVRAARFMMVSLGFFAYRDQLPLAEFGGRVDPDLRRWLEREFQAIVDG
ncbi:MAG TPA: TetR family transcriptional regulator [Sphingopyxis sp.]|nr:TetR family transcriptional regulator [Sphingopyxis sp.]HMP46509.1 TetR family transcriptional regulator [Sphingopyxis sp.]HMQ18781.1 TetR family transcriptional regulator [Sphingopyxis sp.]